MKKTVEIRLLSLRPGTRTEFQRLYVERGLPLLLKWNMDVVAFGPSHHDDDTFYVIRAFDNARQRDEMEDAYYASADWRDGPREGMLELIEDYHDVILEVDEEIVAALRETT